MLPSSSLSCQEVLNIDRSRTKRVSRGPAAPECVAHDAGIDSETEIEPGRQTTVNHSLRPENLSDALRLKRRLAKARHVKSSLALGLDLGHCHFVTISRDFRLYFSLLQNPWGWHRQVCEAPSHDHLRTVWHPVTISSSWPRGRSTSIRQRPRKTGYANRTNRNRDQCKT